MPAGEATVTGPSFSCKGDCAEQDDWREFAPRSAYLRARVDDAVARVLAAVECAAGRTEYEPFERELITHMFRLGRLLIALFLCLWEEQTPVTTQEVRGQETYRRQPAKDRLLGTFFGKVRYWRTYLEQTNGRPGGFYPVDLALGLVADGFTVGVLSRAVWLATRMSYVAATTVLHSFLGWSPSHSVIEDATLGLGRFTAAWVEHRPPATDDGEVLVIQADSKATPTARAQELAQRRGRRRPNPYPDSPRHRGRDRRQRRGSKPRRKKGDKAKNGRMATIIVMYTLRHATDESGEPLLLGPVNRWQYASYAPKRHAIAIARREANKRGFTSDSGRRVQILTDGDEDLARYVAELFPEATHSLDVIHAVEYLWKASTCLHRAGSAAQRGWVEQQKDRLYAGQADSLVASLRAAQARASTAGKRRRLTDIANYFAKRTHMMAYGDLARQDLELSTGIVEGAVRYVIAQRFDEGGMRWIKERAEALLQLRCIALNGDWDAFISFAHAKLMRSQRAKRRQKRVQQHTPQSLPTYGIAS